MSDDDIAKRFKDAGIDCSIDNLGEYIQPTYDTYGCLDAYVTAMDFEGGLLYVKNAPRVFIPEHDIITEDNVNVLLSAVNGKDVHQATVVTRGLKVVGMFVLVRRN